MILEIEKYLLMPRENLFCEEFGFYSNGQREVDKWCELTATQEDHSGVCVGVEYTGTRPEKGETTLEAVN